MKKCTKCNIIKKLNEFFKNKASKDLRQNLCKKCSINSVAEHSYTFEGFLSRIYSSQKRSQKIRFKKKLIPDGEIPYSKSQLRDWVLSQNEFSNLWIYWVNSGHNTWLRPSCDRTDDTLGYSLDRLTIMTRRENIDKAALDRRTGKLRTAIKHRPVIQYNLENEFIAEYQSLNEAARQTICNQGNIYSVCRGIRNQTRGFKWKYKIESLW